MGVGPVNIIGNVLASDIRMATPILIAALGLLLVNEAGLLHIGVEGTMLIATLAAVAGSYYTGSVWGGLLFAVIAAGLMGLLFAFLTITLRANQTVVGVAINILGSGLSAALNRVLFGVSTTIASIDTFKNLPIPGVSKIPIVGTAFFNQMPIVYISFLMVPVISYFLFKTQPGLNLRAVGENPGAADTLGINVFRTRYLACIVGSMLMGVGGAFLSTGLLTFFSEEMVSGRGYIAIAAVIFGRYKPTGIMFASMIFMAGNVLANLLQVYGVNIPYYFLNMLPYILTVVALALLGKSTMAPAAQGKPYRRG
ncbi:MAG: ABC transporter permease [Clostridia bacterium]|nr:ABC transporter permease [Clostridia bacterium]MBQ3662786.1 ABC transporter permease [Clostridia bacterium]MBQ5757908.1 ABC transporter permease [Clostridia bacterium]MCR5073567.1 ABC transporter permease [Clostridiales bacterium]